MSLKDQIAGDIDKTFFNTSEFAELADVNGKMVKIIIDTDALNKSSDVYAQGLSEGDILMFIKKEDLAGEPTIGAAIKINNKTWYVRHPILNSGVYELRLGRKKISG